MDIRKIDAMLEYYCKVQDPGALTDEQWAIKWQNLLWVRSEEAKRNPGATNQ